MEISLTTAAIAALAGMCGTLIGGMQTFIIYGAIVILQCIMTACGADVSAYTTWLVNLFFLPACIFNGTVWATGYAARKYDIEAWQIERSLAFTMTAGYAIVLSGGNLLVAIVAGIVAQVIFTLFGAFFNMGCGSHIDPPAVAIGLCSLVLYMIF